MSEYATFEEARAAKKPGEYICGGIDLPYRVLPVPRAVIDLQRRYEIWTRELPSGEFEAIDRRTFDDEPGSRLHIYGRGKDAADAQADLLDQLAEVAAHDARGRLVYVGGDGHFEPREYERVTSEDPDEEHQS